MGSFLGALSKAGRKAGLVFSANLKELADEDLMLRYGEGDMRAFDILYSRHKDGLFRFIARQVGQDYVDELFQDVWGRLIKARTHYHVKSKFKTYLFTIAHRRVIDFYRQKLPQLLDSFEETDCPAGNDLPIDQQLQNDQLLEHLTDIMDKLPAAQKEAFTLKLEGFTVEEIAETTMVDYETVKSRVRYATQKVKRAMGSMNDGAGYE